MTASRRTFILVTLGRAVMLGSWFCATWLLIKRGAASFGLYFTAQTAIRILTECIGDPLDMAVMRQAPILLKTNRPGALELIRSAFWLRAGLAILFILVALAVPSLASKAIFASADLRGLAILTIAGVLGDFLLRSALGFFQVSEQFGRFLAVDAVWQLGRVATLLVLAFLHKLTAPAGIALYVAAPYVSFAAAWLLLPRDVRRLGPPTRAGIVDILHYSKWIVAGLAMAATYERLDVVMLLRFRGQYAVGIYGTAIFLASIPDYLNGILQTVLAPKVAPAHAAGTFNQLQRRYLKFAVPAGLFAGAVAMLLSRWGITRYFPAEYAASIPAFRILVISTLFNLVLTPLPASLVNFVAPAWVTLFTAIGLIWVAVGALLFIPIYGATGAAAVMLSARVIVGLLMVLHAHRLGGTIGSTTASPLPSELRAHLEEQS